MKTTFKFSAARLGLPIFIIGLGAIIALKTRENSSIHQLINDNTRLLADMEAQSSFLALENNSNAVETSIKSLNAIQQEQINSQDQADIKRRIKAIQSDIDTIALQQQSSGNENPAYADLLKLYIEKTDLQYQAIWAYSPGNKTEMDKIMNIAHSRGLQDSLASLSATLLHTDKLSAGGIANSIKEDGEVIEERTIILAVGTLIGCLLVFWYLYMKKKQSAASERKVKAAASVKENFLANMSHEIRTPLNAILGFTNILQKTQLDGQQQKHIQIIQSSGNNLLSIVNDILDLSKIEAGMMRIEEAPFRIADVMATAEQMLKPKAEEKNLKLIVKVDEEIPETLCGDAVRLTQVLVNLISNAIKFTEEGGVYVKVTPYKKTTDSISLEFHVRDTGIGIPKDKQRFIFERFEQAEAETTRRFGGTGLGLSIVKHLIELQKGTITLNSEEGYGTSFLVELPYKMTNEAAPLVKTSKINYNIHSMNNSNCKILVAEDNIMNQHLIKHLLKTWGFEFDLVFNGVQAIEALKKQNYDLVLMDIQMPEMDGHTATRIIRNELKSIIPVIAMTAHAMSGEREKCIKSGMNDYISKPLNEETLYEFIIRYSNKGPVAVEKTVAPVPVSSPTPSRAKVIDLQYIDTFSEGDPALKDNMIREFVKRVPDNITTLEKAIGDKNYKTIHSIVHDMKTTVHFMGLSVLIGHLLQRIEELASNGGALVSISQMFENVKLVCMQAVHEAGQLVAVA